MFCLYVLEYFFHDFLFGFHNETQIGSIERLGEPVIRLKCVSITVQKRPVANCVLQQSLFIAGVKSLFITGGGEKRFCVNTGRGG